MQWQDASKLLPPYHQTVQIELINGEVHDWCFYSPYMWRDYHHSARFKREEVKRWRHHTAEERRQRNIKRFSNEG